MSKQPNVPNDDEILDPQDILVTLELDDGSELECQILTIFEVDEQDYIALVPAEENEDEEECEVIFYRYFEDEEGNPSLENIEDDDEFERITDRFDELLDEQDYDEREGSISLLCICFAHSR